MLSVSKKQGVFAISTTMNIKAKTGGFYGSLTLKTFAFFMQLHWEWWNAPPALIITSTLYAVTFFVYNWNNEVSFLRPSKKLAIIVLFANVIIYLVPVNLDGLIAPFVLRIYIFKMSDIFQLTGCCRPILQKFYITHRLAFPLFMIFDICSPQAMLELSKVIHVTPLSQHCGYDGLWWPGVLGSC